MKILLLPSNIASIPAITVQALREAGHDARGLILNNAIVQNSRNLIVVNTKYPNQSEVVKFFKRSYWYYHFIRLVYWADIIHWCGSFSYILLQWTMPYIKLLNKPGVVEWYGGDIRIPEVEFSNNPYYKKIFNNGYEYTYESYENSIRNQKTFQDAGFEVIELPSMGQYIQSDIAPKTYKVFQRLLIAEFEPIFPRIETKRPLIVHSPTAPVLKGTAHVLSAIEKLRQKYDFEFRLIQNMPHHEAVKLMKDADIFLDQLIGGGYGMAAMEAMAYGKPVICRIKDTVRKDFPHDLPLVNANPDTIVEQLEVLLKDPKLRQEIGKKSRAYIEKYHDARKIAEELVLVYKQVIANKIKS